MAALQHWPHRTSPGRPARGGQFPRLPVPVACRIPFGLQQLFQIPLPGRIRLRRLLLPTPCLANPPSCPCSLSLEFFDPSLYCFPVRSRHFRGKNSNRNSEFTHDSLYCKYVGMFHTHSLPLQVIEALNTARPMLLLDTSLPIRACPQSSQCNLLTYGLQ